MNKYLGGSSYVDQERERGTERQTERQSDRQRDSPTDRQTVRQTEREKTTKRKKKKKRDEGENELISWGSFTGPSQFKLILLSEGSSFYGTQG